MALAVGDSNTDSRKPLKKLSMPSETSGQINLLLSFSSMPQHRKMTLTFETRTLRYELRSREIYRNEPPITSPETLSEPHETQDESVNTVQEMPNSQFRLFLSVTPCMPRIDSEKWLLTVAPHPHYLAPLPVTSPRTSHLLLLLAPPQA